MAAITTPMDGELAELNRKLGSTVVGYGSRERQLTVLSKQRASEGALFGGGRGPPGVQFKFKAGRGCPGRG
jgi:hypothetical protein